MQKNRASRQGVHRCLAVLAGAARAAGFGRAFGIAVSLMLAFILSSLTALTHASLAVGQPLGDSAKSTSTSASNQASRPTANGVPQRGLAPSDPGETTETRRHRAPNIIVKYKSLGDYALDECAERITRRGRRFADHTSQGGDELDAIQARLGLGRHKALFRAESPEGFLAQRKKLNDRIKGGRKSRAQRRSIKRPAKPNARPLPELAHIYRVEVAAGADLERVARELRADPHVDYAQPDYALALDQQLPSLPSLPFDDPYLSSEGAWGQPFADLWGLERIRAPEVWEKTLGEGIIVAVVDTGLDRFHPDIAANVWVNPGEDLDGDGRATPADENGLDDDGNGFIDDLTGFDFADSFDADEDGYFDGPEDISDADPFDVRGHGSHVSGTIAAVADNGEGIVGVAPGAKIMALKGFPDQGPGRDSVLWRAVLYAAENGATVVNNSWSCSAPCPSNPLAEDVLEIVEALGTVVVTSAGNASTDVLFRSPENTGRVITVGAIGYDDELANFSNRGWGLDIVAPGGGQGGGDGVQVGRRNILSLLTSAELENEEPFIVGGRYRRLAGTSMAAPHVTGAIALLASIRPEASPSTLRALVRRSARDLGRPGHDAVYGAGALDLVALLEASLPEAEYAIEGPASGAILSPQDGVLQYGVEAFGRDVEGVEIAVARGLIGRQFIAAEDLENADFSSSVSFESGVASLLWDLEQESDGPIVFRFRILVADGSPIEEFRVVSIERMNPLELADGVHRVGRPAIDGARVAWPMEATAEDVADTVLAFGFFSASASRKRDHGPSPFVERWVEDGPREIVLDRNVAAWRVFGEAGFRLAWCRLSGRSRARTRQQTLEEIPEHCSERRIDRPAGVVTKPWAGGGWLIWERNDAGNRSIEGCYVGRKGGDCIPRSLVDVVSGPRWRLRSFDGKTMLLQAGAELALCVPTAKRASCSPRPIVRSPRTPVITEPIHDGRLLVFSDVTVDFVQPPGCLPSEGPPNCTRTLALLLRYHACELSGPDRVCESIPISDTAPVETFGGLAVDGRRIVWSLAAPLEEPSLRFCEFEPVAGRCVEQRLTGAPGSQDGPSLSGNVLTWRGGRSGGASIWGYALPDLTGPERVCVQRGRPFRASLFAKRGSSRALSYEIEILDEVADESAFRLEVKDRGRPGGRVQLRGSIPADGSLPEGGLTLRVVTRGDAGLASEWVLTLSSSSEIALPSDAGRTPSRVLLGQRRLCRDGERVRRRDR